ncbi:diguanylate cyclase [Azoarcus sp. DD4]|uniref:sensor domain-containing diguanylate cyclase n=1 Tax=Azoarcus sp. DD4 TaxID=2027405 RepID=UPI00143D5423|nr:diguanylate cyclase [Azoarcus sp. DD4]
MPHLPPHFARGGERRDRAAAEGGAAAQAGSGGCGLNAGVVGRVSDGLQPRVCGAAAARGWGQWAVLHLVLLGALLCGLVRPVGAEGFDVARSALDGDYLASRTAMLADPRGEFDLAAVSAPAMAGRYTPVASESQALGWPKGAIWLRLPVSNSGGNDIDWVLELADAYAGRVQLYLADAGGGRLLQEAGAALPYAARTVDFQHPAFVLREAAGGRQTYYLRVSSENRLILPLRAWQPSRFTGNVATNNLLIGLHFGILLGLLAYNLFLYFSTRERSFLYYVLYLSAYLGAQITLFGIGQRYLWPDWPWLNTHVLHLFADLGLIGGLSFSRHFLDTRATLPRIDVVLRLLIALCVLKLLATPWLPLDVVGRATNLLFATTPVLVVAGALRWHAGFRPARYFTLAWLFLVGGLLVHSLTSAGVLTPSHFTHWATSVGASVEAILLSLALGYRIQVLEEEKRQAERLAHTDPLSGLYNRRGLAERAVLELQHSRRSGEPLALMMCDLDHFKRINDTHGHDAGDAAIAHMARVLRDRVRECDTIARIGGEEFVVLMPSAARAGAAALAERVREHLQARPLAWQGQEIAMSVSIGVAQFAVEAGETLDMALSRADAALYRAKAEGRNRVVAVGAEGDMLGSRSGAS